MMQEMMLASPCSCKRMITDEKEWGVLPTFNFRDGWTEGGSDPSFGGILLLTN